MVRSKCNWEAEGRLQNLFDGESRHADDGWLLYLSVCCATAPQLRQATVVIQTAKSRASSFFHHCALLTSLIINQINLNC